MEYDAIILIIDELEVIQQRALGNNEFYNDSKIREFIEKNGIRYVEDFLNSDVSNELNELNNFDNSSETISNIFKDNIKEVLLDNTISYKDKVQLLIVDDFEIAKETYNIKGVDIKPNDWDKLFDVTYAYYQDKDIEEYYLEDMLTLNRYAFSLALLNDSDVNIDCYLEGLKYMDSNYMGIEDITNIIENYNNPKKFMKTKQKAKVKSNLSGHKIIDFNSYKNN